MINYEISGPSPYGLSHYSRYAGCPLKATLDNESESKEHTRSKGTDEGTLLHAFAELYYGGIVFEPEEVLFTPLQNGLIFAEAARVWRWYKGKFGADEWGEVVATELPLAGTAFEDAVGVAPFTGKVDMVVDVDDAAMDRLMETRGLLIEPGRYIVDHKFLKSTPGNLATRYPHSLQFVAYQLGMSVLYPEHKISGCIVNVIIKTKEPKHHTMVVPFPSERDIAVLRGALRYWKWIKDTIPRMVNPHDENCFPYMSKTGQCFWWERGTCDRTSALVQLPQLNRGDTVQSAGAPKYVFADLFKTIGGTRNGEEE